MSGLLERIVRRRRASASSRLGPPTQNGAPNESAVQYPIADPPADVGPEAGHDPHADENPHANGGPPPESLNQAASEQAPLGESEQGITLVWPPPSPPLETEASALDETEVPAQVETELPASDETTAQDETPVEPQAFEAPTPVPAPPDSPEQAGEPLQPGFLGRGKLRRRARYLRRMREIQLRDIGGFVLELHRFGRDRPDLVQAKVTGAARTDSELRTLERALSQHESLRELREAGVGGACERCGAVHGSDDRFCSFCGVSLSLRVRSDDPPGPEGAPR